MLRFMECLGEDVLMVEASGELTRADHVEFLARLGSVAREYGKARVLFEVKDFEGLETSTWENAPFGLCDKGLVKRFALVGEEADRRWLRPLAEPFTEARFYPRSRREQAWLWVAEGAEEESDRDERIRRLAYARWEAAGRPCDNGPRFWLEAERELRQATPDRQCGP